jgi:ketosteroid isomerase-like protein
MTLSKVEFLKLFKNWLAAWNRHDLAEVMEWFHEDVVFENWTGATITGKTALRKAWTPWFSKHGGFTFTEEGFFVDESEQKILFQWRLEWPSPEQQFIGKPEIRRGADILHFLDGKIHRKYTYSKTMIHIDSRPVFLQA